MPNTTYAAGVNLNLAATPLVKEEEDPILYQELSDLHGAIENLAGETIVKDYFQEVAAGRVPGSAAFQVNAVNPDIDSGSGFEVIWDGGGTYIPPTAARVHDIVSTSILDVGTVVSSGTITATAPLKLVDSSATFLTDGVLPGQHILNDTASSISFVLSVDSETEITLFLEAIDPDSLQTTGLFLAGEDYRIVKEGSTGAAYVSVNGLDAGGAAVTEMVLLNGTTNVPTVNSYLRQFRLRAFAPVTTGTAGIITSTAQTDGTVSAQINLGNNQSQSSAYRVPEGTVAYLHQWWGSLANKVSANSNIKLMAGNLLGFQYIIQSRALDSTGSSEFHYEPSLPLRFVAGTDVWVEADSNVNNLAVASGACLIIEDI
ncbi:MAG: hypothetical protein COB66_01310 [Coxiella sp. (in: Bacteria)]|nr:MAG: hypothetical protein COB66_01310 [Coxiella sp. (in: g-proteobacteria)]